MIDVELFARIVAWLRRHPEGLPPFEPVLLRQIPREPSKAVIHRWKEIPR
jgi:hypothetical protein